LQIRIEGRIQKLSVQESIEYFKSRPLGSQIGALVSSQSEPIQNRDVLLEKEKELQKNAQKSNGLNKPDSW